MKNFTNDRHVMDKSTDGSMSDVENLPVKSEIFFDDSFSSELGRLEFLSRKSTFIAASVVFNSKNHIFCAQMTHFDDTGHKMT